MGAWLLLHAPEGFPSASKAQLPKKGQVFINQKADILW